MSLTPSLRNRVLRLERAAQATDGVLGVVLRPTARLHDQLQTIERAREAGRVVYVANFIGRRY